MNDPYKVLGVAPNATEAQIKEAYRELAKKYHPDKYINNPLADLAAEKMQEINEAYDYLMKNKSQTSGNSYNSNNGQHSGNAYGGFGGGYNTNTNNNSPLNHIRRLLNENRIDEAERALNNTSVRNAEWHYLMGIVKQKQGWHDMAYQHFARATQLDPFNIEYRNAFNTMNQRRNVYTNTGNGYGYNTPVGCCTCDNCSTLICADCCCELMGGDLIPCC